VAVLLDLLLAQHVSIPTKVIPWAFSPRTCSVGKAGTHCHAKHVACKLASSIVCQIGERCAAH
jgi:hypothetical protein